MNKCHRPIENDDGTAVMCITHGHCGCDEQDKLENWNMNWIKATETPPPFGKRIIVTFGAFANDRMRVREMAICTIVMDSPNDDEWGERSEYKALLAGDGEYHEFQFCMVAPENEYAMPIDASIHGDSLFMGMFSDDVSHWALIPEFPDYDA